MINFTAVGFMSHSGFISNQILTWCLVPVIEIENGKTDRK